MDEPENVTEGGKIHPFGNEEVKVLGMWLDGKRVKIDPNGAMTLTYGSDGVIRAELAEDVVSQQLKDLVDAVDLMLEYNTQARIAHVMTLVEEIRPKHLGWGSWLAAEGYQAAGWWPKEGTDE